MGCENSKYVGRDVMLEYAIGCGDELPEPQDWKQVGAMRAKNFGLTWDSTDVTADDSVGLCARISPRSSLWRSAATGSRRNGVPRISWH